MPLPPTQPVCLTPKCSRDQRGIFVKTWHPDLFSPHGIRMPLAEEFFSVSGRGVIRGMHFQTPPHDHEKIVYCPAGRVLDVVLDLRRGPTFGAVSCWELSAENGFVIHIPRGFAHGFLAREDNSVMIYKTSTVYSPEHDAGIAWDSFGFNWPVDCPVLSERDREHPSFASFESPFGA